MINFPFENQKEGCTPLLLERKRPIPMLGEPRMEVDLNFGMYNL